MTSIGRLLVAAGIAITAVGLVLLLVGRFTGDRGLPGDLRIERGNVRVYLPLASMLVLSLVLTLVLNLWARWRR